MSDFETELKHGFLEEATQILSEAEQALLDLESNSSDTSITDKLFRLAHNLKGSGRAVGFTELGTFTHKLESLLLKVKEKEFEVSRSIIDLLLACNDHLQKWIAALKQDLNATYDSQDLLAQLDAQLSREKAPLPTPIVETSPFQPKSAVEAIPSAEVSPLPSADNPGFGFFDDPPKAPMAKAIPIKQPVASPKASADESIRVSLSKLEKLLNFVGEIVILQTVLKEQSLAATSNTLRKAVHQLGKVTKEVQDISMSLRMIPVKGVFQKMQRIVRDTSAALGKNVNLILDGEETEVDKTILETLGDPLVHMIRNAVDHGIEMPDVRTTNGKDATGTVLLTAKHESGSLVIEVSDDGAGLDPNKLRKKGLEKGLIRPGTEISDFDALQLIFAPGFSTKAVVTDVSGRGVGMDVVRTNIDALQGEIQIDSKLGEGTSFKIYLPLTLAIIDGMSIRCANQQFVIPLSHVHETVKPTAKDLHQVTGMGKVFCLRGENLPLFHLASLLGKKVDEKNFEQGIAIVYRGKSRSFAILVDDIIGQVQIVIKQLGVEHRNLKAFSGSAILGDGKPALILDLENLAQASQPSQARRAA